MRVLLPDLPPFHDLQLPGLEPVFVQKGQPLPAELDGAVIWFMPAELRRQILQQPGLSWALTLSAGVDGFLSILPSGVRLYNASPLHDDSVAQHVAATILSAARELHLARDAQREGRWIRQQGLSTLQGRQVVIWGYGHIGRILDRLLTPFGARVQGIRSGTSQEERDALLAQADYLVLLLPLTDQTRGGVDAQVLACLKPGAWLVNDGRGALVDTDALVGALESGSLGGAILDVTEPEPLPEGHPLWSMPNVIITPHTGGATEDLPLRGAEYTRSFLQTLLAGGEPEGRVNLNRGY